MSIFGLEYRHEKLLHEVDLVIKALTKGHSSAAENSLIILKVARDSDIRMGEEDIQ
jgi:hypothetical protein